MGSVSNRDASSFGPKWENSGASTPTVHLEFTPRALSFFHRYGRMEVLARDHPEGASNATSNCKFRLRAARSATAPESDALRTAVRSLQGVFRGRPRGLPGLRMQREGCHWQTCSERCGGVKRLVSQRGIRRINLSRTDAWPSCLDAGLALASKKDQCFYSVRVFGAERTNGSANSFSVSAPFLHCGTKESRRVAGTTPRYRA